MCPLYTSRGLPRTWLRVCWDHYGHITPWYTCCAPIVHSCIVFSIFYWLIFHILSKLQAMSKKRIASHPQAEAKKKKKIRKSSRSAVPHFRDPKHKAWYRRLGSEIHRGILDWLADTWVFRSHQWGMRPYFCLGLGSVFWHQWADLLGANNRGHELFGVRL